MLVGTALYICLLVYAGLSLFIISGLYVSMVVCVVYAYNLKTGRGLGRPPDTVNKRAVRTLLEYILVLNC